MHLEAGSARAKHRNLKIQKTRKMLKVADTGQVFRGSVLEGKGQGGGNQTCRENEGQEVKGDPVHGGESLQGLLL